MARMDEAILYLYPKAEFSFLEEDYTTLKWYSTEYLKPTLGDIEQAKLEVDKIKALKAIDDEYADKFAKIKDDLFNAIMLDDEAEQVKLKADYAALKKELEDKKEALQNTK